MARGRTADGPRDYLLVIIYRDIKPENVMIRLDGYVKVLDFGLVKSVGGERSDTAPTVARSNTKPGVILGSFRYMSPEQARGLDVDRRSDIFSLGALIHEMVSGQPPFSGATPSDVLAAILEREPPPLPSSTQMPAELGRIVSKALRKDREERYQATKDMLLDLKALKTARERPPPRRRSTRRVGSIAVLYYYARDSGKAIDTYRKALQLDPDFVRTHYFLGLSFLAEGDSVRAVSELERAIELSGENTVFLGTLGLARARGGDEGSAREILEKLEARSRESYVPALNRAMVEIGLGETDAAFEHLEKALEERSSWLVSLKVEPLFDSIRGDARFEELTRRVGLPTG
jgi:serine/threonine protein kinase